MRALLRNTAFVGVILGMCGLAAVAYLAPSRAPGGEIEDLTGGTSPDDEAAVAEGKRLFTLSCATEFCHGPGGTGKMFGPPNAQKLTDGQWYYGDGSYASIIRVIKEGLPGSPMEPWEGRLGMERVRQVAAYVLSLSKKK